MRKIDWVSHLKFGSNPSLNVVRTATVHCVVPIPRGTKNCHTRRGYSCMEPGLRLRESRLLHTGIAYKSAEAEMFSMKHSSYGYDVICFIGELRFKQHRTAKEIAAALNERGIPTSERHAQNLYERYQTLLAASLDDHVRKVLAETTELNGWIILSMDGVQPEKGNETLYVVREVFSGTATELKTLIEPIIELGYPIAN